MLVKNVEKFKEIETEASGAVVEAFCNSVEAAMSAKLPVSQGVHDKYIVLSVSTQRSVQQINGLPQSAGSSSKLIGMACGNLAFDQEYFATLNLADISQIASEEGEKFVRAYETGVEQNTPISQGLHDRYTKYCVSINRKTQPVCRSQVSKFQSQLDAYNSDKAKKCSNSSSNSSSADNLRCDAMAALTNLAWNGPTTSSTTGTEANKKQNKNQNKNQDTKQDKKQNQKNQQNEQDSQNDDALFAQLDKQADQHAAKIAQLSAKLEQELVRQMKDSAEAQRLNIENVRLRAENAKMRELVKS